MRNTNYTIYEWAYDTHYAYNYIIYIMYTRNRVDYNIMRDDYT